MRGKTVVITGGTSGIGEVAAEILAKKGARIVLVARDKIRGEATLARLRNSAPGLAHSAYFADLTRLAEMKRVAAQIADHEKRIDVLINNAGALFARRRLTRDGLEFTFPQRAVGLPLAARCAIFSELPLTREGCRNFCGGDGSDVPSAGMITSSNRPRFFAGLTTRNA
jgi:NAD(P)-dependent dehydrogenase (short-subunit alcohol dehydrogenase family)